MSQARKSRSTETPYFSKHEPCRTPEHKLVINRSYLPQKNVTINLCRYNKYIFNIIKMSLNLNKCYRRQLY